MYFAIFMMSFLFDMLWVNFRTIIWTIQHPAIILDFTANIGKRTLASWLCLLTTFTKLVLPFMVVICSHLICGELWNRHQVTFHGRQPMLPVVTLLRSWRRRALFARSGLFEFSFKNIPFLTSVLVLSDVCLFYQAFVSLCFSFVWCLLIVCLFYQAFVSSDEGGDDDSWSDAWYPKPWRNSCEWLLVLSIPQARECF